MASHEMKIRIMNTVSPGTQEIRKERLRKEEYQKLFSNASALEIVHGDVCIKEELL